MPLYEYQCDKCEHRFELIQKFSDAPVSNCPKCDGAVTKLLSSPAIQFKGTGWYITDYARKPSGGEASSSNKLDASSKKDSSAKKQTTDSKTSKPSKEKWFGLSTMELSQKTLP